MEEFDVHVHFFCFGSEINFLEKLVQNYQKCLLNTFLFPFVSNANGNKWEFNPTLPKIWYSDKKGLEGDAIFK